MTVPLVGYSTHTKHQGLSAHPREADPALLESTDMGSHRLSLATEQLPERSSCSPRVGNTTDRPRRRSVSARHRTLLQLCTAEAAGRELELHNSLHRSSRSPRHANTTGVSRPRSCAVPAAILSQVTFQSSASEEVTLFCMAQRRMTKLAIPPTLPAPASASSVVPHCATQARILGSHVEGDGQRQ